MTAPRRRLLAHTIGRFGAFLVFAFISMPSLLDFPYQQAPSSGAPEYLPGAGPCSVLG